MSTRAIIVFVLLLVAPIVLIGAVALLVLASEQARLDQMVRDDATYRAQDMARNIDSTVAGIQSDLIDSLRELDEADVRDALRMAKLENPLVRNVFAWSRDDGLSLPRVSAKSPAEDQRFAARYEGFFSGRMAWARSRSNEDESAPTLPPSDPSARQIGPDWAQQVESPDAAVAQSDQSWAQQSYESVKGKYDNRDRLRQFTRLPARKSEDVNDQAEAPVPAGRSGWIAWFWEDQLYLLGWLEADSGKWVRGIEIEMMGLLSRLLPEMTSVPSPGVVFRLLDGNGSSVYQSGQGSVRDDAAPLLSVPVGGTLPHWTVGAWIADRDLALRAHRSFYRAVFLIVLAFLASILVAGLLLLRIAHRSRVDAVQKTSFVSNVSHELKTPLTSIRMYAELLAEGRVADAAKRDRYLTVITSESQRLTRLVNNVLDFGRLEQGRKTYQSERFDLAAVVAATLEAQRLRLDEAGFAVTFGCTADDASVSADRDCIEQILLNLIENAIKYAGGDGATLDVDIADAAGGGLALRVSDRGPGVSARDCRRIFQKFYRTDDSLTAGTQGSGLGLSIARHMARDMHGDLVCAPRPGGGATFTLTIPQEARR